MATRKRRGKAGLRMDEKRGDTGTHDPETNNINHRDTTGRRDNHGISIVSAGPTLARWKAADFRGTVIAINRAAEAYAADWWCVADPDRFDKLKPLGKPSLFVRDDIVSWFKPRGSSIIENAPEVLKWGQFLREGKTPMGHAFDHAAPAALLFAGNLAMRDGIKTIDCYGVDMAGEDDFTGETGIGRSKHRWANECSTWNTISEWLAKHGVQVVRRTP